MPEIPRPAKPVIGPAMWLGFEYAAIKLGWLESTLFIGVLAGVGLFWLLMGVMKAVVRKWPSFEEWTPFLNARTNPALLTSKYIAGHTFCIAELARNNAIYDRTFEDCTIHGPAILVLTNIAMMVKCDIHGDGDATIIELSDSQLKVVGPIRISGCVFRRCQFHGIGFTGSAAAIKELRGGNGAKES